MTLVKKSILTLSILLCFTYAGEKIAIGGFALKILKKLNGLTFLFPFKSIVLANAIGLGPTIDKRYWCRSFVIILSV